MAEDRQECLDLECYAGRTLGRLLENHNRTITIYHRERDEARAALDEARRMLRYGCGCVVDPDGERIVERCQTHAGVGYVREVPGFAIFHENERLWAALEEAHYPDGGRCAQGYKTGNLRGRGADDPVADCGVCELFRQRIAGEVGL